jgi:hypothetical protein
MTADTPRLETEALDLINAEVTARLERQAIGDGQIDTKAIVLVGYAGAASAFLATRPFQPVLAGIAFAAYAAAAAAGLWAYAVGTYQDVPDPRWIFDRYAASPRSEALAALAATRVEAFECNARQQKTKIRRWWVSLTALMIGIVLMVASVLAHTSSHDSRAGSGPRSTAACAAAGVTCWSSGPHRPG